MVQIPNNMIEMAQIPRTQVVDPKRPMVTFQNPVIPDVTSPPNSNTSPADVATTYQIQLGRLNQERINALANISI